jgi:pyridoxamine 5'-phosphate oxidase family protein
VSVFSDAELRYLAEGKLGRLATIDASGQPHNVPVGWSHNQALDTIDIGGRNFAESAKYRHVQSNPKVAFTIDDVLAPWRPRAVMILGTAEAVPAGTDDPGHGALIRITPTRVISWGLDQAS